MQATSSSATGSRRPGGGRAAALRCVVGLLALAGGLAAVSTRAEAAGSLATDKTVSQSDAFTYSLTQSTGFGTCVRHTVTFTAFYDYTRRFAARDQLGAVFIEYFDFFPSNVRVVGPKVVSRVQTSCVNATATNLTQLEVTQRFRGYSCSFNPSISVGVPFAVGISAWPSCGNKEVAAYTTANGADASLYTQFNSAALVRLGASSYRGWIKSDGTRSIATYVRPDCYGYMLSTKAYKGGSSDTYNSAPIQWCLSPTLNNGVWAA